MINRHLWHRSVVPSDSPARLAEHLGGAEWHWFQVLVAGKVPEPVPGDEDVAAYDLVCDLPSTEIIGFYRDQRIRFAAT